jgi:hypothetical protein
MGKIAAATALYFGLVFGTGFLLGPIRVLLLEPRLGAFWAVALEMPLLLIVMVAAARWSPRKAELGDGLGVRVLMGTAAIALVLIADFSVGRWIRGLALADQIRHVSTPEGLVYAAALVLFAAMPAIIYSLGGRR